eukprot:CAMPEP_0169407586 /NCGR_PEP_ID=MMETSP1017-20121227/58191_1 /TAXON_ID=342587 /ORGANISM="Karlodinium micrum, Strain CCMP2283" /LENGTH=168 /DNA_ID=CAMNT_0009514523 /DNA_START=500 /DNA_END=1005 /DNA_ORIENTATION=-
MSSSGRRGENGTDSLSRSSKTSNGCRDNVNESSSPSNSGGSGGSGMRSGAFTGGLTLLSLIPGDVTSSMSSGVPKLSDATSDKGMLFGRLASEWCSALSRQFCDFSGNLQNSRRCLLVRECSPINRDRAHQRSILVESVHERKRLRKRILIRFATSANWCLRLSPTLR